MLQFTGVNSNVVTTVALGSLVYYQASHCNNVKSCSLFSFQQQLQEQQAVLHMPVQAAAAAEVQTELASRVSNWRHKIQPLLDEQDARPSFDIHLYGDQVLDKLARLSCTDPAHPVELEASTVCMPPPAACPR